MAETYVQLAADGSGKKVQTFENLRGADTVESQGVVVVGTDGAPVATATEVTLASLATKLDALIALLPTSLSSGRLKVEATDGSGPLTVDGTVTVGSSALPTGAATEATLAAASAKLPSVLASDRLKVDGSGVTQPVSAASLPLPSGAATEATLAEASAKLPAALVSGRLSVDGSGVTQPVSGTVTANPGAATSGGATPYRYISAAAANQDAAQVKGSAGQVYAIYVTSVNAAMRYLKLYDSASGVTSASTPVFVCGIPGNTAGAGGAIPIPVGLVFASGIQLRLTTGSADNDANAVASGEIVVSLGYK